MSNTQYRIRLDQLHSSNMRDKTQDDLNMAVLLVKVDGNVVAPFSNPPADGSLGDPITGALASGVHSGDTILFRDYTPDNAPAWEFSFDGSGPDNTTVELLIAITNTHGGPDMAQPVSS